LRDKTLAGKQAIFDVEIVEVAQRIVPDITDEFAAQVRPGMTQETLMAELRKAIDEEDKKEFAPARNQALSHALAQVMEVAVPDTLVTNQAREKFAVMMAEMRDNGVADEEIKRQINPENFKKYKDIVKDDIIRDFKVSMATDEIARLESIQVPDYQIEEQMEAIRKDAAQSSEEFDEKMIRAKVEATLTRQAVMDWLAERSNLEVLYGDKEEEFDEAFLQQLAEESLERERKLLEETNAAQAGSIDVESTFEPAMEKAEEPATESEPVSEKKKEAEPEPTLEAVAERTEDSVTEPEPVVESSVDPIAIEPVVAEKADKPEPEESEEDRQKRYANMSLEERAFQVLKDIGALNKK
jgi:trigger factor